MSKVISLYEAEIAYYRDIQDWLIDKLELPNWYGRNLDALWDCLTGHIDLPVTIRWVSDGSAAMNSDYTAIIELLQEAAEELGELRFEYVEG